MEKAAAQVVLMDCFKQYFSYAMLCICGIPEITLEGTADDWTKLREKALQLAEYDLEWWIKALEPVLDQFVAAASGKVDKQFWCKIYHQRGGKDEYEPGPYITGWILTLFPYVKHDKRNEYLTLWQEKDPASHVESSGRGMWSSGGRDETDSRGLMHYQFPPGISSTPFTWKTGTNPSSSVFPMHFYAGFMTISQNSTTLAIRPEIGWAVADDETFETAKIMSGHGRW